MNNISENRKIRKFNFFMCKFAKISYDTIVIYNLNNKKINIQDVETVNLFPKEKKITDYTIIKFIFILFITTAIMTYERNLLTPIITIGLLVFFTSLFYRKKIIELRIKKKNGEEINLELKKIEERRVKLFIKKINIYKECLVQDNFHYNG